MLIVGGDHCFDIIVFIFCMAVSCAEEVCGLLYEYVVHICSDEIVGIAGKETCYTSAFSVLNVMFDSWDNGKDFIIEGIFTFLKNLTS